jgi:hypothetical protein
MTAGIWTPYHTHRGALIVALLLLSFYEVSKFAYGADLNPPTKRSIDMTVVLVGEHGEPLKDPFDRLDPDDKLCAHCAVLTLGRAVSDALNFISDDERSLSGDKNSIAVCWPHGSRRTQPRFSMPTQSWS